MKDIMNFGIEEARRTMNENKGGPFGAVITDSEGNIISVASNRVLELHDATAHAEVMAIREAGKILGTHDLSGCNPPRRSWRRSCWRIWVRRRSC